MNRRHVVYTTIGLAGIAGYAWAAYKLMRRESLPPTEPLPVLHQGDSNLVVLAPEYGVIRVEHVDRFRRALDRASPPLSVVIHTLGGSILAVDHIAHMLRHVQGKVTVYVPYMALSGGTMIALAADEIVMGPTAILGPVDPQIDGWPAVGLMELIERKPPESIDDAWMLLALESRKAVAETRETVRAMVQSPQAVERLTSGETTHARPISFADARAIGLPVRTGVPPDVLVALDDELARVATQRGPWGPIIFQADARSGLTITRVAHLEPERVAREERLRWRA
ncbi:MAG: ATP-dependent Clp protease proteolytic subunit [Nannocystaceae bacterium]